ncbi:hypothetical protein GOA98_28145 [Sinorhizobium meliloti]|nr:hypothetical protein [Sinorhizobium meliloti]
MAFDNTFQALHRAMHDGNVLKHRCILDIRKVEFSVAHSDEIAGEALQCSKVYRECSFLSHLFLSH